MEHHTMESTFLAKLKSTTGPLHRQLENSPISTSLMDPAISSDQYALYLVAMHSVVSWYEKIIFPSLLGIIPDIKKRQKKIALEKDIQSLGKEAEHIEKFEHPGPSNIAKALGFLYVIEGSTLGGMVIIKYLQDKPFLTEQSQHFFTVYGRNTGIYWKEFLTLLSAYAIENQAEDEIIEGALEAFSAIDKYFISIG